MMTPKKYTLDTGSVLDLRRRGYRDPSRFPTVAAFAALPKPEQAQVVITCKRSGGLNGMAVEAIPVVALHK